MCGIFCIIFEDSDREIALKTCEICKTFLDRRGPDYQNIIRYASNNAALIFAASVLWLQGEKVTEQPIETKESIFTYNGNLYNVHSNFNTDTEFLLHILESSDMFDALSRIQGPFAFVYFDKRHSKLYFCRDFYGRRSLIIGVKKNSILLTSVGSKNLEYTCIEIPAIGLFMYDLNSKKITVHRWKQKHRNFDEKINILETLLNKKLEVVVKDKVSNKTFTCPNEHDLYFFEKIKLLEFSTALNTLLQEKLWNNNVQSLKAHLSAAVQKRINTQPKFCINCIKTYTECNHATVGILFSGGVDCSILALLADSFVDANQPIDLLNVAFKPNAPDRKTATDTFNELNNLLPNRLWNLVEIDVSEEELNLERSRHINNLIYPLNTILDDSLGCALWFASRGKNNNYVSPCRILLVGMGADELFGGYTKHRAALKQRGWLGLLETLEEDWQNISHRNLARDDRVVSDHGRQLCAPFLDEEVVEFTRSLHCWEKTCPLPELPQGLGEKILLRSLAFDLGLKNAAYFKKRALQFGSRIANSKEKANNVSCRL